ncbi:MAG: YbgC/FadM family acyl-CoA thioesterase [Deltaproteobacteria bacterium]|nr:YbgC/FadM family acyl-CoA thioesterase [Deltaproteobacteria bacterium]
MGEDTNTKSHRVSYRVIYGDTDQMGVAYYANHLKWFEMGRNDFMRKIGTPYTSIEKSGLMFPVTEVACRYHRPARYDDEVVIETSLTELAPVSLIFSYRLTRKGEDELIATGWTKHACVDREGQITKMLPDMLEKMKESLSPSAPTPQKKKKSVRTF